MFGAIYVQNCIDTAQALEQERERERAFTFFSTMTRIFIGCVLLNHRHTDNAIHSIIYFTTAYTEQKIAMQKIKSEYIATSARYKHAKTSGTPSIVIFSRAFTVAVFPFYL